MKPIIIIVFCVILIYLASIVSCSKETESNRAPVAKTGGDILVELLSCNDSSGTAELDGSGSVDPDSNIVSYRWVHISGHSPGFTLKNADSPKATLENISFGDYYFQLIVTDERGLSSNSTVKVSARLKVHNMDLSVDGNFNFTDNYYYYDFYYDDYYYDLTELTGKTDFDPLGEFQFQLSEYSDTAELAYSSWSTITIYKNNINEVFVNGNCSLNLKRLIQTGGGAFSGVVNLSYGSSAVCNVNIAGMPPLTITGNLDTASKKATLRLQGQVYL